MTSTDIPKIVQNYLQLLGIGSETSRVYLELAKIGPVSALQIAKATGISRTQVYRHLEELQSKGLVSAEQLSYGTLFRFLPLENVEALVAQRETASIKRDLGSMTQLMQQLAGSSGQKATIQHYYGVAGLKQVNWNLTKAKKEYRTFEAAHLPQHFAGDEAFARRCHERYVERQLTSYDLTNETHVLAADLEPFEPSLTNFRHLDPEILTINFEMYIYDDTVTLLDYSPEQQMATEIHHPTLAAMMRQLFDAMWALGTDLEIR